MRQGERPCSIVWGLWSGRWADGGFNGPGEAAIRSKLIAADHYILPRLAIAAARSISAPRNTAPEGPEAVRLRRFSADPTAVWPGVSSSWPCGLILASISFYFSAQRVWNLRERESNGPRSRLRFCGDSPRF